jgi:hypothetical protein
MGQNFLFKSRISRRYNSASSLCSGGCKAKIDFPRSSSGLYRSFSAAVLLASMIAPSSLKTKRRSGDE